MAEANIGTTSVHWALGDFLDSKIGLIQELSKWKYLPLGDLSQLVSMERI